MNMWWNKGLKRAFVTKEGALRGPWLTLLLVAGWYALMLGTTYAFSHLCDALMRSWGVTTLNLSLAPKGVQYLARQYLRLSGILGNLLFALCCWLLMRKRRRKQHLLPASLAFPAGAAAAALTAGLFLLTDSMRVNTARANWNGDVPTLLAVLLAASLAEALAARGVLLFWPQGKFRRLRGYVLATAASFVMTGVYGLAPVGWLNGVLVSLLLCALAEKFGWLSTALLRTGWRWVSVAVLGFPGGGCIPVWSLYALSEKALTGGNDGLACGLWVTALGLGGLALVFRREIIYFFREKKYTKRTKTKANGSERS